MQRPRKYPRPPSSRHVRTRACLIERVDGSPDSPPVVAWNLVFTMKTVPPSQAREAKVSHSGLRTRLWQTHRDCSRPQPAHQRIRPGPSISPTCQARHGESMSPNWTLVHTGDCSRFRHPGAAWPDDTLRSASPLPLKDNTPHPHECGTRWRHTTVTELPPASRWKPPLEASYTFGGSYLVQLPPPGVQRGKVSACMGSCSIYRVKCPPVHRSWTGPLQHEPRLDHWQCRRMN